MSSTLFIGISILVILAIKNFLDIEKLQARVERLENQKQSSTQVEATSYQFNAVANENQASNTETVFQETTNPNTTTESEEKGLLEQIIKWYKQDWLLKSGAILLVLAFGWFTSFAFANNWIIPEYRILLGLVFGFASILVGYLRFKNYVDQAIVFLILGVSVVSATVYAANAFFGFITPIVGLTVIFLASALVSVVSFQHKNRLLTVLNLLVSTLAPLLTGSLEFNSVISVFYLLAIFAGVSWLSIRNDWNEIPFIILASAVLYSPLYSLYHNSFTALFFITALFILIFTISFIRLLTVRLDDEGLKDFLLPILNTFFIVGWIYYFGDADFGTSFVSGALTLITVLYGLSAYILSKLRSDADYSLLYTVFALILTALVAANELSNSVLAYFYLLFVFAIYFGFSISKKYNDVASNLTILYVIPLLVFGARFIDFQIFDQNFFFNLVFVFMLFTNAYLIKASQSKLSSPTAVENSQFTFKSIIVSATALAFSCYWFSLKSLFTNFQDLHIVASLTTFTIFGLIFYFIGFFKKQTFMQYYGAGIVISVLLRLFFIDIWNMPITTRIAVFFAVGLLLITTAFVTTRLKKS